MDKIKSFLLAWAEIIDAYRVAPRAVLVFYGWLVLELTHWIMLLPSPTGEQSAVVMAAWGAAGLIFNFYAKSGRAWGPQVEWTDVGNNDYLISQRNSYYGNQSSYGRQRSYSKENSYSRGRKPDRKSINVEEEDV